MKFLKADYPAAIADYTIAINNSKEFEYYYMQRGNAYYELGELENAIKDYSLSIKTDSTFHPSYLHRGFCYFDLSKIVKQLMTLKL